jgi:tetratricopeptide (TPR) repeat protein
MENSLRTARKLYEAGRFRKAENIYENILSQEPLNISAIIGLSNCLFHTDNLDKAEKAIKQVFNEDQDYALAYTVLGKIQAKRGDEKKAIKSIKQAIQLEPGLMEPYVTLSAVFYHQAKYREMIALLKQATALEADKKVKSIAYNNLALAYIQLDKLDKALRNILVSIKLKPSTGKLLTLWKICMIHDSMSGIMYFIALSPLFLPYRIALPISVLSLIYQIVLLTYLIVKKEYKDGLIKLGVIIFLVLYYFYALGFFSKIALAIRLLFYYKQI